MISNEIKPIFSPLFLCEKCNYSTSKKSNMTNHIKSAKHIKSMISNEIKPKLSSPYICLNCDKYYKDYSGLWRHKKKGCNTINKEQHNQITPDLMYIAPKK